MSGNRKTGKDRLFVGITGGMGAGKSALAACFAELGYPVFSADEIAREITEPGSPALAEISRVFGPDALRADGSLNRGHLRSEISLKPALRAKLEAITHPLIQARSQALAEAEFKRGARIVFYEAPLLFEAKSEKHLDAVICVHADDELRVQRILERDGRSRDEAERLVTSQMPQAEKMKRSDYLVENHGVPGELKIEAARILEKLTSHLA